MTILTSSATLTIGAGSTVVDSVSVPILPLISSGTGKGRLIHPTLGTLDYENKPDEWVNIDQDIIVAPIWTSTKTLKGAINVLSPSDVRDVVVEEHWTQDVNVTIQFLRMLLAFWQNPPDPVNGTPVQWWPNYATTLGYNVVMLQVDVGNGLKNGGSNGIVLNALVNDPVNWVTEQVSLTMRILGRL